MRALLALIVIVLAAWSAAGVTVQAGPYRIDATTQPRVIPVGSAKLMFAITDSSGKPAEGLRVKAIARMPGMFMGEREQVANPVPGKAGVYAMTAAFSMAGAYEVAIDISGDAGAAKAIVPMRTGQDTGSADSGFSIVTLLPWIAGLALVAFVVYRMRKTGAQVDAKGIFNRGTVGGILLLGGLLALAVYAVNNWRRPGAMTPLEAQVMEMNTPAPPGTTAVLLGEVGSGGVREVVRYSGQARGYVEQDVNPRVQGVIVSMPFYVGDRVRRGEVLARLDTSQLDPQLAERAAMTRSATEGVGVAAMEYQTALQEIAEAKAEQASMEGMVEEARAMLTAAREDKQAMEAELAASVAEVATAEAEVSSASEAARVAAEDLSRKRTLFNEGLISKADLQRSEAENADAQAKLRQAQSMVRQRGAQATAARANARKADAMIIAAQKRLAQAQADVRSAAATIRAREAAAAAAKQAISRERAGVDQAKAGYAGAAAQRGYSQLKAEVDGVVTERTISPGVLVAPGQTVMRVAQVSPIRVQANVPTTDLSRIRIGSRVTAKFEGITVQTRVRSIAPSVDPRARTGVVEAVIENADRRILPGQFVDLEIEVGDQGDGLRVPVGAVVRPPSPSGDAKTYVWVASAGETPGQFTVRRVDVRVGASDGRLVAVEGDLSEGQKVVVQGGAYLREGAEVYAPMAATEAKGPVVEVYATGFKPETVTIPAGETTTVTFIRRSEEGCGTEVLFPDLGINKPLPLNKPVEVALTPDKAGSLKFSCGMDMLRGKVIVR